MLDRAISSGLIDRIAVTVSGLCVVHCIATAVLIGLVSSASVVLGSPVIHEVGLMIATTLAAVGLIAGWRVHGLSVPLALGTAGLLLMAGALLVPHGALEAALTVTGVCLLGLGHHRNIRARA
jgi:hypothetical protein